jgi:hypothetical protein
VKYISFLFLFIFVFTGINCGKKSDETNNQTSSGKTGFTWKDNLALSDIPDSPVKGILNGKEITFYYINFEKWRGSHDNVLSFSVNKPEQPCGFIENFKGFQLINKGNAIQGEYIKAKFDNESASYSAYFKYNATDGSPVKSNAPWNCALKIDNINDKIVSGRIAISFNDDKKSWVAGKFEASICNN